METRRDKNNMRVLCIVLALLSVIFVAGTGQTTNALSVPVGAYSAQSNEFEAVSLPGWREGLPGGNGAYGATATLVDAQANLFAIVKNEQVGNNNITWVEIARYLPQSAGGGETGRWYINPPANWKIDGITAFWSGTGVEVLMSAHTYGPVLRERDVLHRLVPGIFVNGPGLMAQAGRAGVFQAEAMLQGEPVDYGRIQDMITAAENNIVRRVKVDIYAEVTKAINDKRVLTEFNGQDYFYKFFKDRLYEVYVENVPGYWEWAKAQAAPYATVTPTATPSP